MDVMQPTEQPKRSESHRRLGAFAGRWKASGTSYGGPDQDPENPKSAGAPWESTHEAKWFTGEYFLVQEERARIGGADAPPFDTLYVIGVNEADGRGFAKTFENHGFYRLYTLANDGSTWTLSGVSERATIEFSDDGAAQRVYWEWLRDGRWLPLCERTAIKIS